jgi:hypothetical protein
MRLLNTANLQLEEFPSDGIPSYAILSHRWESEEVTFQDLREGRGVNMAGYSKITGCCRQAALDGWQYAWVDSCCIDKSSSAELSEAINSMFEWYRDAQVCYAYLSDVGPEPGSTFEQSKWFTRGWTLQELLAPEMMVFFDRGWREIGTKLRMRKLIESVTGITHLINFEHASVAQKMSWASRRETTRVEDQAYCLMGLFGVNMPPLYGEGQKAFLRLQLTILGMSDDESIFAWTSAGEKLGLLAQSAGAFEHSGNVLQLNFARHRAPYSMTNKGLRMETPLIPVSHYYGNLEGTAFVNDFLVPLNCQREGDLKPLSVHVRKVYRDQFLRIRPELLIALDQADDPNTQLGRHEVIYIKQQERIDQTLTHAFSIDISSALKHHLPVKTKQPDSHTYWQPSTDKDRIFLVLEKDAKPPRGVLYFSEKFPTDLHSGLDRFAVALSTAHNHPGIDIICPPEGLPWQDFQWAKTRRGDRRLGLDKLSKKLASGASVSVKLRKDGKLMGVQKYLVEISVDPKGSLPWPDPEPDLTLTPFGGIRQKALERALSYEN